MSQKTHILVLDSKDRFNYDLSNSNDCRLTIEPSIRQFNKIELLSFSMPLTQYNITETNNQVYFNVDGNDYTAELTVGSYNACNLPQELKRAMEDISGHQVDIWYDSGLFKFVFTIQSGTVMGFNWNSFQDNTAAKILGFSTSTDITPAGTVS